MRDVVAGASGDPDVGFIWIKDVEAEGRTMEQLGDSDGFASLDAKYLPPSPR